jgi:hypothetical protein
MFQIRKNVQMKNVHIWKKFDLEKPETKKHRKTNRINKQTGTN